MDSLSVYKELPPALSCIKFLNCLESKSFFGEAGDVSWKDSMAALYEGDFYEGNSL